MRVYGSMREMIIIKEIKRLGKIDKEVEITNKQTIALENGQKVHFATIKRNRSVTKAK